MTPINVGDRVRITRRVGERRARQDGSGLIGSVVGKRRSGDPYSRAFWVYTIQPESGGSPVSAYEVVLAPKPEPLTMTAPEPKILVDEKRVQAAQLATEILGKGADLDKLIGLAEFILGAPTTGRMAVSSPPLRQTPRDENIARLRDRLTVDTSKPLELRDSWGDLLTVRRETGRTDDVIGTVKTTEGHTVILTADQRDKLVRYLNAL